MQFYVDVAIAALDEAYRLALLAEEERRRRQAEEDRRRREVRYIMSLFYLGSLFFQSPMLEESVHCN